MVGFLAVIGCITAFLGPFPALFVQSRGLGDESPNVPRFTTPASGDSPPGWLKWAIDPR